MVKFLTILFISTTLYSATNKQKKVQYKTFFGSCPSRVAGKLTLDLVSEFEKNRSLLEIKEKIVKDKLDEKHFLSTYSINYHPVENLLKFKFDCPKPLLKAQIYKKNGDEFYTAILVDNGKFVDPTYEVLLRSEKKLNHQLPHLAYPVSLIDSGIESEIKDLVSKFNKEYKGKISEIIVDDNKKLTLIFSINRRPTSAFLGAEYWGEKVGKLIKIIDYMKEKKTIPAVINLTNSKKVVVKFSDTI
tara:strand:- start:135458 stop:136192 length:735 start_codon:yes stop_codon:yes gene_type:complete